VAGILPIGALGSAATSMLGGIGQIGGAAGTAGLAAPGAGAAGAAGTAGIGSTVGGADAAGAGSSFVDSLGQAMQSLNGQLNTADASMADFASGGKADIQSVMLDMQEASIGLKVGIAVRDKLLEAYQEIMRMPI
jgi:flagellar hook-basal body complex protein FliE